MKKKLMKRGLAMLLSMTLCVAAPCATHTAHAFSSDNGDGTFTNPVIFSDVPDEDIIRVDDAYYMISTTMHMSPGAPIMKSYNLVNWEIVNYVYDYLEEDDARSLKNGKSDYAYGSWAASLRYDKYQKRFYVTFSSQTTPKSYFFITDDIEHGSWHRSETEKCYDSSFLFVDTGTKCEKYMIIPVAKEGVKADGSKYSYNQTEMCELIVDETTWDVSLGSERTLLIDNNNVENPPAGLAAEGVHAYKIGDYYYLFMIQGAGNPVRQQICWRSKTLEHGSFEVKKVFTGGIVDEDGKTVNSSWGIAQGGIVQTPEGHWYSIMFQDYHSVGRIPVLVPLVWGDDGWPVFGNNGKSVQKVLPVPVPGHEKKSIVESDEFDNGTVRNTYDEAKKNTEITAGIPAEELEDSLALVEENEFGYNGSNLKLVWQWNHNPNNNLWSLTERAGYLRLKSGLLSQNIRTARNTLTQRTCGPTSGATTAIEVGHMRDGDAAGIAAFQNQYGFVGVKMENGTKYLVMHRAVRAGDADGQEQERVPLTGDRVYLKVNCDFRENTSLNQTWRMKDEAYFYYSLDGESWTPIGDTLNMSYDWPDFMGYRFGLFYYSTQNLGGYVDFDYFHISPVDGQKQELQAQIREAESIQRQPHHTEQQWREFTECLAQAKIVVQELPDDESELSLPEIEQSNRPAYTVMEQLQKQTAELKSEKPSETEQPDAPSATATTAPGQPAAPESPSAPSPATGSSAAPFGSPSPDAPGTVKSKKITVKAAGYPFAKQGIRLAKGTKMRLKATVFPAHTTTKTVRYASGNKKSVSVSSKGVVTAIKPGSAKITITAGDGGAKAVLNVTVVGTKKANRLLTAAKKSIVIKKGSHAEFVLKKKSAKSTSPVIYKSSNRQIATVDPYGSILGKKKGKTKIRAICGTKSVSLKVEVK